jgi:hypothetical protein
VLNRNGASSVSVDVIRAFVAALLLAGMLTACHSSKNATPPKPATRRLDVELVDSGLKVSPDRLPAADYVIGFEDHRSQRPAGQRVTLQFGPSGPLFAVVSVPAGRHVRTALWANEIPWVVIDGVRKYPRVVGSLTITTSKQYPTPAT